MTKPKYSFFMILMMSGLITVVVGCKKTGLTGLVPAEGVIYCDGVPLEGAIISFFPSSATGRTAVGRSDSEGKFTLTTLIANDGAFPDSYKIAVLKVSEGKVGELEVSGDEHARENTQNMRAASRNKDDMQSLLPQKYSVPAISGLTWTLPEKGDKNIKLEISMKN